MEAELRQLRNAEVRIPYYTWGLRDPQALLLMVHGLKSHAAWFLESGAALARRGILAYLFDRRGSGNSECERGHVADYQSWLDDIRAMAQQAREDHPGRPLHLLGHCFGAKLSLGFALRHPGLVQSLALIAPPNFSLKADLSFREKLRVAWSAWRNPSARVRVPIRDDMFTRDPERCRFIREDRLKLDTASAQFYFQAFRLDRRIRRDLGELSSPTLVLVGSEDEVVDVGKVKCRLMPRLKCRRKALEIFPAAHDLLFEPCREQVLDRIAAWIREEGAPVAVPAGSEPRLAVV